MTIYLTGVVSTVLPWEIDTIFPNSFALCNWRICLFILLCLGYVREKEPSYYFTPAQFKNFFPSPLMFSPVLK
jgi:hypothetical protein